MGNGANEYSAAGFSDVPIARFAGGLRKETGPENRPFPPTGEGPSSERSRSQVAGFRAHAETWSFGRRLPEIRNVGSQGLVRESWGRGLRVPAAAFAGAPIARLRGVSRRKWGPEIDHPRRPAGAQVSEHFRLRVARFRPDA